MTPDWTEEERQSLEWADRFGPDGAKVLARSLRAAKAELEAKDKLCQQHWSRLNGAEHRAAKSLVEADALRKERDGLLTQIAYERNEIRVRQKIADELRAQLAAAREALLGFVEYFHAFERGEYNGKTRFGLSQFEKTILLVGVKALTGWAKFSTPPEQGKVCCPMHPKGCGKMDANCFRSPEGK